VAEPDKIDCAYLRVSSNEQRRRQTIRGQRGEVQRYLDYAELTDVLWLADDGVQGDVAFEKRPDGGRLLRMLGEGRVRTVVVLKIDRLGRSALEILRVVEAIRKAGVRLVSIKESIDLATPTGMFFLNVLAAFAELDRAWITERTTMGRRAKVEAGQLLPTARPLYGYRWRDREKGLLEPDPLTASVVERVFRETLAGRTLGEIGADLERDGIAGPGGGGWHRTTVRNVLRHPYYAGQAVAWPA
jgi:site-specific DNA recombinase